jgi:hypothetical protein
MTHTMRRNGKRLMKHFVSNGIGQDCVMEMKSRLRSIHGLNFALKRISLKCLSALHQSVDMGGGETLLLQPQEQEKRLSLRLIINVRTRRGESATPAIYFPSYPDFKASDCNISASSA